MFFIKSAFSEITDFDSRLLKSLKLILTRPGEITKQYNNGVRTTYFPPIKLYLIISLILFVTLNLFEFTVTSNDRGGSFDYDAYVQPNVPISFYFDVDADESAEYREKLDFLALRMKDVNQGYVNAISQAMFLLLPFFAIYLNLLLKDKKRTLAHYLIYALHFHIFIFFIGIVLLIFHQIIASELWALVAWVAYFGYLILSLKKAFELKWGRTLVTSIAVTFLHFASFIYVQEVIKTYVVMSM